MASSEQRFRSVMHAVMVLCTALLCVAMLGCGGTGEAIPRAAVSGTVTLDGEPLPAGVVYFAPTGDTPGPRTGAPVADGAFALDARHGPPVGPHRVEVRSTDDGGLAFDDESAPQRLAATGTRRVARVAVPDLYTGDRSPLTATVTADGENHWNFPLGGENP